ncbi:MAG: rhodanese-like domain-containing protein [Phycisphaerales bacterium]|nr:rhodanese-like domain-containing protein [Phycisphaerales bacterium]
MIAEPPGEWDLVRLHNAILVPLQQWSTHLESLEPHKDQPIIIYCHHGVRSLRLAMLLRQEGFTNIRSMAGGIDLWAIDVDQRLPRY